MATQAQIEALTTGLKANYNKGLGGHTPIYERIAETIKSTTAVNLYGWLQNGWPQVRKWIGDRQFAELKKEAYSLLNEDYESSFAVKMNDIDDDQIGIYASVAQAHGKTAIEFKDKAVFDLLKDGFSQTCFDGQNFFDAEHPVVINDVETMVSNVIDGAENPFYLVDTNQPLKPFILQERQDFRFTAQDDPSDENVFMRKELRYGIDGRFAFGYGFWQQCFASKEALTAENLTKAITKMESLKNHRGAPLGVQPNLLVVGNSNRWIAQEVLKRDVINGTSNILKDTLEIVHCRWLP